MAALLDITPHATDRIAAGFAAACPAGMDAVTLELTTQISGRHAAVNAGDVNALVVRCVL